MSYSTRKRTSDDIIVKEFWRNNERFADLFNAVLFKGKCVIKAEKSAGDRYRCIGNNQSSGI